MRPVLAALAGLVVAAVATVAVAAAAPTFDATPLLPDHPARQISPHVWVLEGFPNVAFVVGDKATLAIDTGLGPKNGATVAREARRLSTRGQKLYLTTTHFHPEHAAGEGAFPAGTTLIRPRAQQEEYDADGPRIIALFASRSATQKALLDGVAPRKADVLFDRDYLLDLGGTRVRLMWRGAAHTRGDELIFVEGDRVLIPGDVVQDRIAPNAICDTCSPKSWLAVLDAAAALKPRLVVPDHGLLGDAALIPQERAYLIDLQARAMALKAQGKSAEEAGRIIAGEFAARYDGWLSLQNVPAQVAKAYAAPS